MFGNLRGIIYEVSGIKEHCTLMCQVLTIDDFINGELRVHMICM